MKLQPPGRAFWMTAVKIAVIAAIVALIGHFDIINAATIARIFSHPIAAALAVLAIAGAIHVSIIRWYLLLAAQGQTVSFRRLWNITFLSYFLGSSTLGAFGVDALRLYYIGRERSGSAGQAYLSILVDRLIGLFGLLSLGAGLFAVNYTEIGRHHEMIVLVFFTATVAGCILLAVVLIVVFDRYLAPLLMGHRSLHRVVTHVNLLVRYYRNSLPTLGLCLIISVLVHALTLTSLLVLTRALFGPGLSIAELGLAGTMATIANQIPITPGGLALGEGAFAYLCQLMSPAMATSDYGSAIFLQRFIALAAMTPGLYAYFVFRQPRADAPVAGAQD